MRKMKLAALGLLTLLTLASLSGTVALTSADTAQIFADGGGNEVDG